MLKRNIKIKLFLIIFIKFLVLTSVCAQANEPHNTFEMVDGVYDSSWLKGHWEFSYKSEDPKVFWNLENSYIKSLEFDNIKMRPGGQALLKVRGNDSYTGNFTLNKNREGSLEVWVFFGSWRIHFLVSDDYRKLVHKSGGAYFDKESH